MSNLTPTPSWDDVYQLETTDPALGGAGGIMNSQAQSLTNRTEFLSERIDDLLLRNPQAQQNVVLTGAYDSFAATYTALSAPAANTLQLNASPSFPFIYAASGGYDEQGEIVDVKKITTNMQLPTSGLPNRDYLALVQNSDVGSPELGFCQADLFYAGPWEPDEPTGYASALWLNTVTGISYTSMGGGWFPWRTVIVGKFSKTAGAITGVETFPYRSEYYEWITPAGTQGLFASGSVVAPLGGWLYCNGASVSRKRYARLFAAIGTTYGSVDADSFTLPSDSGNYWIKW